MDSSLFSAANDAAATIIRTAADAANTFAAGATAVAGACASALAMLWERCKLALARLFGTPSRVDAASPLASLSPSSSSAELDTPTAHGATTGATTDATTDATAAIVDVVAVASATVQAIDAPVTLAADATRATEPELEAEPEAAPAHSLAPPRELAEHELSRDDLLTMAIAEALTASHAALERTPVSFDTVSRIISCLHAKTDGQGFALAYPFAIIDVVLRALACHAYDVGAAYAHLSGHWVLCYRSVQLQRKWRILDGHLTGLDELTELRLSLTDAYIRGIKWYAMATT